jgi:hypothetical protein
VLFGKSIIRSRAQRPAIAETPRLPGGKLIAMFPANGLPCSSQRASGRFVARIVQADVIVSELTDMMAVGRNDGNHASYVKSIDAGATKALVATTPAQSCVETRPASFAQTARTHGTFHPDNVI